MQDLKQEKVKKLILLCELTYSDLELIQNGIEIEVNFCLNF